MSAETAAANPATTVHETDKLHPATAAILKFFAWEHLPAHLQAVSQPFSSLAHHLVDDVWGPGLDGPEMSVCLRKLLEAKDCAVRAVLR